MYTGYTNKEVRAMYGIPYNQLTDEQKAILHADSKRRAKLIKEREEAVLKNNLKAFDDEAKMEKFLASLYKSCQKQILADVAETVAKVQKEGGTWSYANQSALTRSRGLFEQIQQELTKLGQAEEITFREGLGNIYTDQFLRQVYTLGQTITVNANFNRLNPALVRKTLDYPWSGAMFSDRIWLDKEQLGKNLRLGLTQSMILGEDMAHISQRINKNIDTSEYNAMRLARTETKRVTYVAHDDVMADCGVEKVKYRCANGGDSRTCKVCLQYNDEVFERGTEPQLPIHPNCRCVYVAEVSDTFKDNELNELTQSVRGAENYEKWKEAEAKKIKKQAPANTLTNSNKSDKVIQLEAEKNKVKAELDAKTAELSNVSTKYQADIDRITADKVALEAKVPAKKAEIDALTTDRDNNRDERRKLRTANKLGLIKDADYDKQIEELISLGNSIEDKLRLAENEYYQMYDKINAYNDELRNISHKISSDRFDIERVIQGLTMRMERIDNDILVYTRYQGHTEAFIEVARSIEANNVEARVVKDLPKALPEDKIIERLAGGDLTDGSCSSLAFSYIGNKAELDVLDFRGGNSRFVFSQNHIIEKISKLTGVKSKIIKVKKEAGDTAKILKDLEKGKEFYLATGKHAAIIRNTDEGLQYLELQSGNSNGWKSFDNYGSLELTLRNRFGCRKTVDRSFGTVWEKDVVLMEVDSFKGNEEFRELLSYINTDPAKQKKGVSGSVK